MRIVMEQALRSETPRARPRTRRGEHLVAADTSAVVAVVEQHRGPGIDYPLLDARVAHGVDVDHVGAPRLERGERPGEAAFAHAPRRRAIWKADFRRARGRIN